MSSKMEMSWKLDLMFNIYRRGNYVLVISGRKSGSVG